MRMIVLAVLTLATLAGCNRRDIVLFEGIRFDTRLEAPREDRRSFTVLVRGAAANVPAALQAGAYEGTQHCLKSFGNSRIAWATGPDRVSEEVALAEDGSTVMQGRCVAR